jgi:hypothetical protein
MSDVVLTALIANAAPIIVAITGFVVLWRKMEAVRHATNSKMDELLKVTGEAEHAKGVKQGEESKEKPAPQ